MIYDILFILQHKVSTTVIDLVVVFALFVCIYACTSVSVLLAFFGE